MRAVGHLLSYGIFKVGLPVYVGAQKIFNVLGSLNNGPEVYVYFRNGSVSASRLTRDGDFNIDTITLSQLQVVNQLQMIARLRDGTGVV